MTYVLKFGGGDGINHAALARDVAKLASQGEKIIIVTGANAELSRVQKERGITPRMITSERGEKSRYTDEATLELLKEVYGGVCRKVAELVTENGAEAQAFLGSEENLITAKRHGKMRIVEDEKVEHINSEESETRRSPASAGRRRVKVISGDLTGSIENINKEKLLELLDSGKVIVITPPAITTEGVEINVDGDKVAAKIAVTLQADKLIFFSNTKGLLKDVENPESLIPEIKIAEADNYAVGRMKKKILSAKRAIEAGVGEIIFADGRIENSPIQKAINGIGSKVF